MKLHRITYTIVDKETTTKRQEFAASGDAASKRATQIKKDMSSVLDDKPVRDEVDVPTSKAELIDWLNKHASVAA